MDLTGCQLNSGCLVRSNELILLDLNVINKYLSKLSKTSLNNGHIFNQVDKLIELISKTDELIHVIDYIKLYFNKPDKLDFNINCYFGSLLLDINDKLNPLILFNAARYKFDYENVIYSAKYNTQFTLGGKRGYIFKKLTKVVNGNTLIYIKDLTLRNFNGFTLNEKEWLKSRGVKYVSLVSYNDGSYKILNELIPLKIIKNRDESFNYYIIILIVIICLIIIYKREK